MANEVSKQDSKFNPELYPNDFHICYNGRYNKYGSIAVFFAGFTPIPYKVFTIASGVLNMNWWKFTLASFFGRAGRFFVVSIVLMLFGEMIKQYLEIVIAVVSIIIVVFFVVLYYKGKKSFKTNNIEEKSEEEKAIHNL